METTERADQLVNIIGDLLAMAQDAVHNGELVLAYHLQKAAHAALIRLGGINRQLAEAWSEVYRCNRADRTYIAAAIREHACGPQLDTQTKTILSMAAELVL